MGLAGCAFFAYPPLSLSAFYLLLFSFENLNTKEKLQDKILE